MAPAEVADLRAMPDDRLREELEETLRALFNLRFQAATRQLADVSQVRASRRRVARIRTLLRERDLLIERSHVAVVAAPPPEAEPAAGEDGATDEAATDEAATDEPAADEAAEDRADGAPEDGADPEAGPDGSEAETDGKDEDGK